MDHWGVQGERQFRGLYELTQGDKAARSGFWVRTGSHNQNTASEHGG